MYITKIILLDLFYEISILYREYKENRIFHKFSLDCIIQIQQSCILEKIVKFNQQH